MRGAGAVTAHSLLCYMPARPDGTVGTIWFHANWR
jgi:hypothetical protein